MAMTMNMRPSTVKPQALKKRVLPEEWDFLALTLNSDLVPVDIKFISLNFIYLQYMHQHLSRSLGFLYSL